MDNALRKLKSARPAYKATALKLHLMFALEITEEDARKRWDLIKGNAKPYAKVKKQE